MFELSEPLTIIAPLASLVVVYILFYEGMLYNIGNKGTFWTTIRSYLPYVDDQAREHGFYTSYEITSDEYVCTLDMDREEAVELFVDVMGFIKAPLAAHKTDWEGRDEVASLGHYGYDGHTIEEWGKMKRFIMFAFVIKKQHPHVTLFESEHGIVVTAHSEWSPYNVFKSFDHLVGKGLDVNEGITVTKEFLDEAGVDYEIH